jgi:putative thioredoxin
MRPVPRIRAANHDGDVVLAGNTIVATAANFMSDVVEASGQTPVLVDFWAPWCGPCQSLTPLLERLVDDYAGRFILAKLNIDEQPQLATHFQVRSIPTLMLVHAGEVVDQIVGAQSEAAIRAMLDRHVGTATADTTATASVTSERPASPDATPDVLAATLLERRDADGAAAAIEALAASEAGHPALKSLRARLAFLQVANAHPDYVALRESLQANPGDSAARHALAAHHALLGDYGTALAEWLELMRRDRRFGEEAARRSLLEAFDVLGDEDPLVVHYRRRMASLLH